MFSALRPTACTTGDINLGSWLMLRGAKLEGVELIRPGRAAFTFSHKHLSDFIHEYEQAQEVRFAPKVLFQFRDQLKRFAPFTPKT